MIALPHSYAGMAPEWLTIEDRRMHERDLLAHYLSELRAAKVDAPTCDEAWFDYRRLAI